MVEARGGRDGGEGLRRLQGRVEPVLVLAGYWRAEDGLSTDRVREDGRRRGVPRGGHHLLESLASAVLVSHQVWTEPCNNNLIGSAQ